MPLAEGVQASIRYKPYPSGAITPNSQPVLAAEPGASGGQLLRRTASTLNLRKDTYRSAEIRADRQVGDMRHGTRRVEGSISGEWSPATYAELIAAAHRHSPGPALSHDDTDFTSLAADAATGTLILAGGDPVAEGYRVGDVIRLGGLATMDNAGRNFLITGFGGTANRTINVTPAPATMAADSSFSITRPGTVSFVPASGHVSRKFLVEVFSEDIDLSRLFTECRITGYRLSLPASGMATIEVMAMGRDMQTLSGAAAPFLASPAGITSTGILAAVNGALYVSGAQLGVVTALDVEFTMAAEAPAVVGQDFVPEIMLGTARVSGRVSALLQDASLIDAFADEAEGSILMLLEAGTAQPADAVGLHLPRIKFGQADVQLSGEGPQLISLTFEALRYLGSAPGIESTTIRLHDMAA